MKNPMKDHFMEDLGELWDFFCEVPCCLDDVRLC